MTNTLAEKAGTHAAIRVTQEDKTDFLVRAKKYRSLFSRAELRQKRLTFGVIVVLAMDALIRERERQLKGGE